MEKSNWVFCRGNQGDADFRVSLQNDVIIAALYSLYKDRPVQPSSDIAQVS